MDLKSTLDAVGRVASRAEWAGDLYGVSALKLFPVAACALRAVEVPAFVAEDATTIRWEQIHRGLEQVLSDDSDEEPIPDFDAFLEEVENVSSKVTQLRRLKKQDFEGFERRIFEEIPSSLSYDDDLAADDVDLTALATELLIQVGVEFLGLPVEYIAPILTLDWKKGSTDKQVRETLSYLHGLVGQLRNEATRWVTTDDPRFGTLRSRGYAVDGSGAPFESWFVEEEVIDGLEMIAEQRGESPYASRFLTLEYRDIHVRLRILDWAGVAEALILGEQDGWEELLAKMNQGT